jgi:molecular chaperone DnaK
MVSDAESHAAEDKKFRELVESRNRADGLAHATERALGELGEKVSGSDRAAVESALSDLRTAIKGDDKEAIDRKADALVNASQSVMAAAQQAAQGGGANASADAGAQPAGGGQNDKDDVVDAEFEEVKDKDLKA